MSRFQPARVRRIPGRGWVAFCGSWRCKWARAFATHNGAHAAKAAHNRTVHA